MINFIPLDFYELNKKSVYSDKDDCLSVEGSAVGFNSNLDLYICTIIGGVVVESATKVTTKKLEPLISEKYNQMVAEIYAEMLNVFGTSNDVSASAFAATFEAMIKRPESYIDAELGFADAAAVTAYATAKIASSDAYGVFRMKRIAQFNAEKQAILDA